MLNLNLKLYDNLIHIDLAKQLENNNVISLEVVKKEKEQPKPKKDGTVKRTPNNNTEERWVHPIRNKEDIKRILEYLHEQAGKSNRKEN